MTTDYECFQQPVTMNMFTTFLNFRQLLCHYHFNSITGHQEFQQCLYGDKRRLVQGQLQVYFVWSQSTTRSSSSCCNRRIRPWHQLIWGQTEWRRRWKTCIRCRLRPQDMKMCSDWYLTEDLFQLASCFGGWGHWLFTFLLWWFFFFFTDLRLNAVLVCQGKPFNRLQRRWLGSLRFKFYQLHWRTIGEGFKTPQ